MVRTVESIRAETKGIRTPPPPRPIEIDDIGDEQMQSSFAAFNGLRLINLSNNSKFARVVQTMSIDGMIKELRYL